VGGALNDAARPFRARRIPITLLMRVLPLVAEEDVFALKGGAAPI
jgi:hypothetical protein